jgi:hypothetical protein
MLLTVATTAAIAPSTHAARRPPAAPTQAEPPPASPVLPEDVHWARGLLTAIAIAFAAALLIGPFYRMARPSELPPTHSHDEPPGASHHHGRAGTYDHYQPERRP